MSKWRKILYIPGRIGAASSGQLLVACRQDTRNVHHFVACSAPKCDFREEKVAESGSIVQIQNGKVVKMEKILVKMEKMEKISRFWRKL